ncbi:MAG TPA: alpha/beta hydrolase family protein [Gemmatimonadales bacterium]|nr:alpha/beta hydrolase family protein [Gemmatimonadales bacterium]
MRVLLVHGLGRTPLSLQGLARTLRRSGHVTRSFGYYAFAEHYDQIRQRLASELRAMAREQDPVALVGHSLGGLLLRHALSDAPGLNVHRLIMLGTPNQPPRLAVRAKRWLPFRVFARSCGHLLATPSAFARIPPPAVPYTLIAGTMGWRRIPGPFGGEPNDGLVAVSETMVRDGDEPHLLPISHTFMMNDRRLRQLVLELLTTGDDPSHSEDDRDA